jgi:hypothetical protein
LVAVAVHCFLEWMVVVSASQYLFAASLGIITGMRSRFLAQAKMAKAARRIADRRATQVGVQAGPSLA